MLPSSSVGGVSRQLTGKRKLSSQLKVDSTMDGSRGGATSGVTNNNSALHFLQSKGSSDERILLRPSATNNSSDDNNNNNNLGLNVGIVDWSQLHLPESMSANRANAHSTKATVEGEMSAPFLNPNEVAVAATATTSFYGGDETDREEEDNSRVGSKKIDDDDDQNLSESVSGGPLISAEASRDEQIHSFKTQYEDDCLQFRAGLGYSGFNLFGGGCLNINLPTMPAQDIAGEYDVLYLNYIRHHIRRGRMKYVTVEHQQTAKGNVSVNAVQSPEGMIMEYRVNYDCRQMDLPPELVCTDNFCFTESKRTIDQIQFNIEDEDDGEGQPHPYQDISEGPVWGCISVIEKPIAIGWLPGYFPNLRMVRDKTDDDDDSEEEENSSDEEGIDNEILAAEFPYNRSKAFMFDSPEEAYARNNEYYNTDKSWLVRYNILPPELAMLVRTYLYPPPALIFEKGDIWFSACWNDDDSEDGITWSTIARPRVLIKDLRMKK